MKYYRSTTVHTSSLTKEEEMKAKEKLKEEIKKEIASLVEANSVFFKDYEPLLGNTKILCIFED